MIASSTQFANAVASQPRTFRARILLGGTAVDCEVMKATIRKGASDAEQFLVGSVYSSSAEIVVSGLQTSLVGRTIALQVGVVIGSSVDYITVGTFVVSKVSNDDSLQTITAQGVIASKMNEALPTVATQTLANIANAIQTTTGVTVTFDSGITTSGVIAAQLQSMTCRSALALLAFIVGGYATETASGGVVIKKYASGIVDSIIVDSTNATLITSENDIIIASEVEGVGGVETVGVLAENCLTAPVVHESDFNMTGVKVIVKEEYETEDEEGQTVVVPEQSYESGTVRQVYDCEYMTEALFTQFADNVIGYRYMPAEIDMSVGDPRIEPWDVLRVQTVSGEKYNVPCHYIEESFDGGFSCFIRAVGETEEEAMPEGTLTQQMNSLQTQVYSATDSATTAHAAAESAKQDAADAAQAASDAQSSADAAAEAASNAQGSADSAADAAERAQSDANSAANSASTALTQLDIVENVVGVLDLLAKNGDYRLTADIEAQPNKWYFTQTTAGDYQVVREPESNPQAAGYYELVGINQAVRNYVSSHLVLAANGLWLQTDGSAAKLQLSTENGVVIYNENGTQAAQYGTNTVIGDPNGFHIKVDAEEREIGFYNDTVRIAYMSSGELYVENSLSFGNFMFYQRLNGHFTLKYIGGGN